MDHTGLSPTQAGEIGRQGQVTKSRSGLSCTDLWKIVVWRAFHDRALTPADRDVLLTLAAYAEPTGTAWPSQATLAERTRRHARTVRRALAMARGLGLVEWTCGGRWIEGGQWRRRSNRYRLLVPTVPVAKADRGLRGHSGQGWRIKRVRKETEAMRTIAEQLAILGVPTSDFDAHAAQKTYALRRQVVDDLLRKSQMQP